MKSRILLGLFLAAMAQTTAAFGDDKAACLDAASKGQRLKATHKLVDARDQLRVCAASQCPAVVQSDCANWLAEVESALPTVVVTARDGTGADLADVKVSVDGQPLLAKLDGQAVPMDAGPHTFRFERAKDDASLERQVIVREGEKNQAVAVVLGAARAAPAPPSGATGVPSPGGGDRPASTPWKTIGWVLGGAGVVGLGVGAAFGLSAMGDKSSADCNPSNQCAPGPLGSARSAALAADVGFVAGGVLLAGGVALVLVGSGASATRETAGSVKVAPTVGASGGGLVLGGSW
jgi:hypothetical protein